MTKSRDFIRTTLISGASVIAMSSAVFAGEPADFDIEAGELQKALNTYIDQSGEQLIYRIDEVRGARTKGVEGRYEPDDALEVLLEDTGFNARWDQSGAAVVVKVSLVQEANVESGSVIRVAQLDREDNDQEIGSREEGDEETRQDVIVVTGTNIRGTPPASPVRVISRDEIDLTGASTVGELLETIPQNFGGGFNEDSTNTSEFSSAVFSGKSTVNLRGLGSSATLVLFNGKRLAASGGDSLVDVSSIPLAAVDRIEILTDGASAIYGSDAVAGVVNFVMRRDYEGAETRAQYGTVTDGDLDEYQIAQTIGKSWGNSNILASYQYYNRGDLDAVDRDFTAASVLGTDLSVQDSIDILPEQESHNALLSGTHSFSDSFSIEADFLFSTREARYERAFIPFAITESKSDQYAATLTGNYDFNDRWGLEVSSVYGFTKLFSDTLLPSIDISDTTDARNEIWSVESILNGEAFSLPAGQIGLALGGQYRQESYEQRNLSLDADIADGERSIWSVFAETSIPIFGDANAVPGFQRLDLSLAIRHEDYSDFGDTTDPKIGLVWSPATGLTFRGTWGTSFRAPNLDQLDEDPASRTAFFFDFPDPSMPDGTTTALLEFSGRNAALGPETSEAFTLGFDFILPMIDSLNLSVTYFNIEYEDRINQPTSSLLSAFVNRDVFASIIVDNPTLEQINDFIAPLTISNFTGRPFDPAEVESLFDDRIQNLASTKVSGIDLSAAYSGDFDFGQVGLVFEANYLFEFANRVVPGSPEDETLNTFLNPVDLRFRSGATWRKNGFSAAAFVNYTDGYENNITVPATPISSWTTVDVNFAYDTGKRLGGLLDDTVFSLNVRNLFDQDPPSTGDGDALVGFGLARPISYDPANASPLGRFISFEIRKSW